MDNLQTKTEKLLKYGKTKLSEKGVESAATDLRGVLDDIGNIEVQDNRLLNVIKGINSYQMSNYPFELTADMFDENSTTIGDYQFYNNHNITKVEIPNNIKTIGNSAFNGCSRLASITIPDSVKSIGKDVFSYCSSLTSITIPNSVTSIGNSAFSFCSSLTSITIPDSVTSIGSFAFGGCRSLTSINIPNSVTNIGDEAFYGCRSLTSINIPNSVTSIEYLAFNYCTSLKIVDFRGATRVPTVQSDSFSNVPTTCKFIIPDELYDSWITATNWASLYASGYQFIKASEYPTEGLAYTLNSDGTSYSCSGIGTATDTNITVAKTYNDLPVTGVANNAFSGNTSITSVIIPDGIESVGFNAFKGCTNLSNIKVFDSVTNIGNSAFDDMAWYDSQSDGVVYVGKVAYDYKGIMPEDSTSITIQDGTLGIAAQCISSNLSSKLRVSEINIPSSVVFIGEVAFSSCSNLTSITIPENVAKIGAAAFYNCTGLTTINWNAINCEEYGDGPRVFDNCNNVTTLNIGNNVQVLPAVFSDLTNITTLTIPSSVTSINGSFAGCTGLTKVTFEEGSQLTHIGSVTFCDCTALNTINFGNISQVPTLDRISEFETIPSTCQIVVPDALYDEWIAATNWVTHASQIVKASEYTEVQA